MNDPTTSQVVAALSEAPGQALSGLDAIELGRRRFLQAVAAGVAVAALPPWLAQHAAAATPLAPGEGILVLVTMAGGNDGLNTFIPIADGNYRDLRGSLAISPGSALGLTAQRALHPELPFMKRLWDAGQLAVIDGVGQAGASLSHFVSMGQHMSANATNSYDGTGWLGRVHDAAGSSNPFHTVAISSSVPLLVKGRSRRAVGVSHRKGDLFKTTGVQATYTRQYQGLKAMGAGSSGLGALGDTLADIGARAVDLATQLQPVLEEDRSEPELVTKMRLSARLINANLGVRVISVIFGDFDSHANQLSMHSDRMEELNTALETFYTTLSPTYAGRTLVVGTSEFGRRARSNGSGTDHGTANSLFAIGAGVRGGFHGALPSLTDLDADRNLKPTVDFRQFYGTIIERWLGGDAAQIVGRDYPDLGFLTAPSADRTTLAFGAVPAPTAVEQRASVIRLYLAYFQRPPDDDGFAHWYNALRSGSSLERISAAFASSPEFQRRYGALSNRNFVDLVYRNVLGRVADAEGAKYWTAMLDKGGNRGVVMTRFSESAEYKAGSADQVWRTELTGRIGRLYWAYFLRRADRAGLEFWINTESPLESISEAFAAAAEFTSRYGTVNDSQFVDLIYANVLGRPADDEGRRYWSGRLASGMSRGRVMLGFSNSAEFTNRIKTLI